MPYRIAGIDVHKARTVEMRDRGELISNFDGTIDRVARHAVVKWDLGPGGRWRYRGFAGKCEPAAARPKL